MTQTERTPQHPTIEEAPISPEEPAIFQNEPIHVHGHIREITIHTYPSHDQHYNDSGLNRDIAKNPALFWGSADF